MGQVSIFAPIFYKILHVVSTTVLLAVWTPRRPSSSFVRYA